jgi:hypothetical protein
VRNPWGDRGVAVHRGDGHAETLDGPLLEFNGELGERITLVREGTDPEQFRRTLPAPTLSAQAAGN